MKGGEKLNDAVDREKVWDMSEVGEFVGNETVEREVNRAELATRAREEVEDFFNADTMNNGENAEQKGQGIEQIQEELKIEPRSKIVDTLKRVGAGTAGAVTLTASVGAIAVASAMSVPIAVASAPVLFGAAICGAGSVLHAINGVNGSMFEVNRKNQIHQTMNPLSYLIKHRGESSDEIFREEAQKLFDGLKSGEEYSTKSHAVTFMALKKMEKEGKIKNLSREKSGTSRLFWENLATGNWEAIAKHKKHDMYNIKFEVA